MMKKAKHEAIQVHKDKQRVNIAQACVLGVYSPSTPAISPTLHF